MTLLNPVVLEELRSSIARVGQISDIIVCKQHPDIILSGRHRIEAGAEKKSEYDCEELANDLGVSHDIAHLLVKIHAKKQRLPTELERQEDISDLCDQLALGDLPKEEIIPTVINLLAEDLSADRVRKLAPQKYKMQSRIEPGRQGASVTNELKMGSIGGASPANIPTFTPEQLQILQKHNIRRNVAPNGHVTWYSYNSSMPFSSIQRQPDYLKAQREMAGLGTTKSIVAEVEQAPAILEAVRPTPEETEAKREYSGRSARMSELSVKADTKGEQSLQTLLSPVPDIKVDYNKPIQIDSDTRYIPDAIIDDWLILEAEGEGSASRDNEKRDLALIYMGKTVIHIPNRLLKAADSRQLIVDFASVCCAMHHYKPEVSA